MILNNGADIVRSWREFGKVRLALDGSRVVTQGQNYINPDLELHAPARTNQLLRFSVRHPIRNAV